MQILKAQTNWDYWDNLLPMIWKTFRGMVTSYKTRPKIYLIHVYKKLSWRWSKKNVHMSTTQLHKLKKHLKIHYNNEISLSCHWQGIEVWLNEAFRRSTLVYWSSELCIQDSFPLCVVCVCGTRVDSNCPTLIYVVRTLNTHNEIHRPLNEGDNHCLTTTSH